MWNFAKLDTAPLNSPPSLFSVPCHPQTVKHHNENPLSCHPFPPKLLPTCENIGLQSHLHLRCSQALPSHTPDAPPATPQTLPQPHPSPPQSRMQFPNRSDSATQSDTNKQDSQRELHAKLLGSARVGPPEGRRGAWPTPHSTEGAAGVEGAGGTGGHGRASRRGVERSEALASRAAAWPGHARTPDWRPPRDLRGLAAVPVGGGRARASTRAPSPARLEAAAGPAGPGRASRRRAERSSQRGRRAGGQATRWPEIWRAEQRRRSGGQSNAGDLAGPRPQQAAPRAAAAQ